MTGGGRSSMTWTQSRDSYQPSDFGAGCDDLLEPETTCYGLATNRGGKTNQEDAYYIGGKIDGRLTLNGYSNDENEGCFGIFDGHGGDRASRFCAQYLFPKIQEEMMGKVNVQEAISEAVKSVDEEFCEIARHTKNPNPMALRILPSNMYRQMDGLKDGSTCLAALVVSRTLYIANVGDSRAVLCDRMGRVMLTSRDQKPNRRDERQRLEAKGATVTGYPSFLYHVWPLNYILDVPRVNGALAMSRSIGDISLKRWITAEPEIISHHLQETDKYLILASDGLWDVCSNRKAAKIASKYSDAQSAADALLAYALNRQTYDNITVLVVDVSHYI